MNRWRFVRSLCGRLFCLPMMLGFVAGCGERELSARFDFDQPGITKYSGAEFCLGTQSQVAVRPYYVEDLPPWTAQTSDPTIFSLERNPDYPDYLKLTYLAVGRASLVVLREANGEKLSEFPIRVQPPDGLAVQLTHPAAYLEPFAGEAVLPLGGGACALRFNPYQRQDSDDVLLYGRYDLTIGEHQPNVALEPKGFVEPFLGIFGRETSRFIVHGSATALGHQDVLFTGPAQTEQTVRFRAVVAEDVTGLEVQIAPYYSDPPRKVGDSGTFVAVQQSVHGRLCRGFDVTFVSETPTTLWVRNDGVLNNDFQDFEFLAPGSAELTVVFPGRPELTQSVSWDVTK